MNYLGIDLDGNEANLTLMDKNKKIVHLCSIPASNVKQLYTSTLNNFKKINVVTALSGEKVLIKHKTLRLKSKNGLKKALPFQLKSASFLPKERSIALSHVLPSGKDSSEMSFYITTKKSIEDHLKFLSNIGLEADYLSFQSQALCRYAKCNFPSVTDLFILHIGKNKTVAAHVKNGIIAAHYSIKTGSLQICKIYNRESSEKNRTTTKINFSEISSPKFTELKNLIGTFTSEIKKAFLSFLPANNPQKIPLLITGQANSFIEFDSLIKSDNAETVSEILKINNQNELPYAISIGLTLDSLANDPGSKQFLQEEFIPRKHLKKVGASLSLIFCTSLMISLGMFFGYSKIYQQKEKQLFHNLSLIEKREQQTQEPSENISFEARKKILEEKIKNELKMPVSSCLAPKVSSFLEWLNKHPLLETPQNFSIQIQSLNYELADAPNVDNKNKKSAAKLSLKLKISDPLVAKKFHDGLSNYPKFIDMEKEIAWDENPPNYTLSFFLKNLTPSDFYDRLH